jgi:hypothetical protein
MRTQCVIRVDYLLVQGTLVRVEQGNTFKILSAALGQLAFDTLLIPDKRYPCNALPARIDRRFDDPGVSPLA